MGRKKRPVPTRMAKKLLKIREHFGFTQQQMVERVCPNLASNARAVISQYERGVRVPSVHELLLYARLANTTVDCLVDDEQDLIL